MRSKAAVYISLNAMLSFNIPVTTGNKKAMTPIFGFIYGHILCSISIASLTRLTLGKAMKPGLVEQ